MKNYISILFLFASISLFSQTLYVLQDSDVEIKNGEITKYHNTQSEIIIPETISKQTVISIGVKAFNGKGISEVVLPESLLRVRYAAFKDNSLDSVHLPSKLRFIGEEAFMNNNIDTVVLPNSIVSLGNKAFYKNNISAIELPKSKIKGEWFSHRGIRGGKFIEINGALAFKAKEYVIKSEDVFFEENEINKYFGPGGDIIIPNKINGKKVLSTGWASFSMKQIDSVVFPKYLEKLGTSSFSFNNLKSVELPDSVVFMSSSTFDQNFKLESIKLPNPKRKGSWSGGVTSGQVLVPGWKKVEETNDVVDGFMEFGDVSSGSIVIEEDLIYTYK